MSAGGSVQLNMKLLRPYTFDECTFDFTDMRCERPIEFFGEVEFSQEITESVHITEKHERAVEYRRAFEEGLALSASTEIIQPLYSEFTERLSLEETTPPMLSSSIVEGIGFSNPPTPALETHVKHDLTVTGKLMNLFSHEHISGFAVQESHSRVFRAQRTFVEKILLGVKHGSRIEQTHIERIGFRDMIVPAPRSTFIERLSIYDGALRASEASLSGIAIGTGMTLEDFKNRLIRPVGFEGFRPFHVGDYEYERALVRISMTAGSFGAIPEIYDVSMNVDIDDTVDRGTARMEAKETVIKYNKHYYTKPEVTVTLLGGNTSDGLLTPIILSIDTVSFTCVLQKINGSAAAGMISWTAVGY